MARANIITRTAPTAPVYVVLDAGFQETKLDKEPEWPDLKRFQPPKPPRPVEGGARSGGRDPVKDAKKPIILFGRGSRQDEYWQPRIRLAERLGACVFTDLKQGAMFPSDNPHHYTEPFNAIVKEARELMCEADVILSLDWMDLGGALRQAKSVGDGERPRSSTARSTRTCTTAPTWSTRSCRRPMCSRRRTGDVMVAELNGALGEGRKDPWKAKLPAKNKAANGALTMEVDRADRCAISSTIRRT